MDGKEFLMRIRKNNPELLEDNGEALQTIANISDALAHPLRLYLFRHIVRENKQMKQVCTKDLVEAFDYSRSTISQHMKKLTKAGLITVKNVDKYTYYYANLGVLIKYIDLTKKYSVM